MTAPKPSAAEVAAEQFIYTLWDGVVGYRSPDLAELAAVLDAFAASAVNSYRRGVNDKTSMTIARELLYFVDRSWGKIGMGVMEQEIANRMEQYSDESVAAEREACAQLAQSYDAPDESDECILDLVADEIRSRGSK